MQECERMSSRRTVRRASHKDNIYIIYATGSVDRLRFNRKISTFRLEHRVYTTTLPSCQHQCILHRRARVPSPLSPLVSRAPAGNNRISRHDALPPPRAVRGQRVFRDVRRYQWVTDYRRGSSVLDGFRQQCLRFSLRCFFVLAS